MKKEYEFGENKYTLQSAKMDGNVEVLMNLANEKTRGKAMQRLFEATFKASGYTDEEIAEVPLSHKILAAIAEVNGLDQE